MQLNKTDSLEFKVHVEAYKTQTKDLMDYNELTRNKVLSCENYLEKYQPLFTQRQIEEVLRYVLTTNKQKYRLKKFSELKNEFLTARILADKGNPNLLTMAQEMQEQICAGEFTNDEKEMEHTLKTAPKDAEAFSMEKDDDNEKESDLEDPVENEEEQQVKMQL